jgi:hypothetical protein
MPMMRRGGCEHQFRRLKFMFFESALLLLAASTYAHIRNKNTLNTSSFVTLKINRRFDKTYQLFLQYLVNEQ